VGARTANVNKTTGGIANVTAKQIEGLSTAISNKTAIDDEAIQTGANLLLTFKNIRNEAGKGNDVFNQATSVITDLSVGMDQSLKSSAVQVGKALDDPIKGITALSRVGVTFDDQQKKQIQRFTESGHVMKAQKIILKELNSEFGGAAAAAATPAEKASVAWKNFQEQVGTALLPTLGKLADWASKVAIPALSRFVSWIQSTLIPAITDFGQKVIDWFHQADESTGGLRDGFETLKDGIVTFVNEATPIVKSLIDYFVSMWPQIKPTIDAFVAGIKSGVELIAAIIATEVKVITYIWDHFGKYLIAFFKGTFGNIITVLRGVFKVIGGIFRLFSDLLRGNWGKLWDDIKLIASGAWLVIKGFVRQLWNFITTAFQVGKTAVGLAFRALWDLVKHLAYVGWQDVKRAVGNLWDSVTGLFQTGRDQVYRGFDGLWEDLKSIAGNAVNAIWKTIRNWFADVIDGMLGFAGTFLNLADKAFGWIPGIGGKLDDAKRAFAQFRDDVNAYLRGIDDQVVTVTGSFSVPSSAQIAKVTSQLGGGIPAATGGLFTGGIPGKDSIHALVMPGEYINKTRTVAREGVDKFHLLNQGKASIVPHFADGGLVVDAMTNPAGARVTASIANRIMSRISSLVGSGLTKALDGIVGDIAPSGGSVTGDFSGKSGIGRGLAWMRSQVGKPYIWGGVGPTGYDCSGLMSVLTNVIRGASNPYYRLGATSSMPWPGFLPGPGNFSVGWTTNYGGSGIGHTAGTLGGLNVESSGGVGVHEGSGARGAFDGGFTGLMHLAGFDVGGLARTAGWMAKGPSPERVLSPRQTIAFERWMDRGDRGQSGHAVFNIYDKDDVLIGTMHGIASNEVYQQASHLRDQAEANL
jgi:phage-related protein